MLVELLRQYQCRVTTAESCTGGAIAKAFTEQSGSSAWYDQGWVTYSAHAKHHQLGVDLDLLHGSMVSQEVAFAMAKGALIRSQAQLSIAVTGVAGPSGGSTETPVGCCWFGFSCAAAFLGPLLYGTPDRGSPYSNQDEMKPRLEQVLSSGTIQSYAIRPETGGDRLHFAVRCQLSGDREAVRHAAAQFPFQFLPSLRGEIHALTHMKDF